MYLYSSSYVSCKTYSFINLSKLQTKIITECELNIFFFIFKHIITILKCFISKSLQVGHMHVHVHNIYIIWYSIYYNKNVFFVFKITTVRAHASVRIYYLYMVFVSHASYFTAGFDDLNLSDQVVSFPEETIILRKTSLKICNHTTDMTFI